MAQNREIAELGQIVTVDMSSNSMTVNGSIILGNSSSNVVINSTAISFGGTNQTDKSYTWTNTHTFTNTVSIAALSANGTLGLSSQVLTTNGSGIYWSSAGVNVNATYTWSNTQTFSNTITFSSVINGTANAANYLGNSSGTITNISSWITTNATAAYTNAVSYTDGKILTANAAITGNAASAYTNATIFASNASNVNTGTLAEARLPYRMDQNVRTTDTVTLGNLTLTGNLYVGSNVNVIGANNLSVVDNMIYLNANNTVANPDLGFAGNYNDGVYHHAGFFRDASDSGTWKVFDNYLPEPDANAYIDTTNTTFHLANFQANTLNAGNTSTNWFIANTGGTYVTGTVNAASHTVGTSTIANSTGVYTGVVNGSSHSVGTAFTANSTVVNAVSYYAGTTLIGNTTGPYGKTEGNLNVNSATYATSAGSATNASAATNATYATSAGSATNASAATNATYATSAGSATNASAATNATTATNQSGGTVSATTGTFSSYIIRSSAAGGWLQGNYASVENVNTPGCIYTIGGSYVPTASALNTMYGVGYTYKSGTALASVAGSSSAAWGFYGCSGGTPRWFLDTDGGNGYFAGNLYVNNGTQVVYNSGTWSINVTGSAGSATNASAATNATYATSAGSATNATYATSAGSATNASAATNATYATSAGSATNASAATNATYATSAGSLTSYTQEFQSYQVATTSTDRTLNGDSGWVNHLSVTFTTTKVGPIFCSIILAESYENGNMYGAGQFVLSGPTSSTSQYMAVANQFTANHAGGSHSMNWIFASCAVGTYTLYWQARNFNAGTSWILNNFNGFDTLYCNYI